MREHGTILKVSLCASWFAMACSSDPQAAGDEMFDPQGDQVEFRGVARKTALGADDLRTYLSDHRYIRGLAKAGRSIAINHADPRQHRFVLARLRLTGKTPENSPELFRSMEALRSAHLASGFTAGAMIPEPVTAATGDLASQHETLTAGITYSNHEVLSGAMASRKESLAYGIVDNCIWDDTGEPIGECSYVEVYGDMKHYVTQSSGDATLAQSDSVEGDSFLSVRIAGTTSLQTYYSVSQAQSLGAANLLNPPSVDAPKDLNGDGYIKICLERSAGDCEYTNQGMWTLRVPLKGSVQVTGNGMQIDGTTLASYKNMATPPGRIYVTLGNNGGGCRLPDTGQNMISLQDFWRNVSHDPLVDPTRFSWDLLSDTTKWANFSNSCQLIQATTYLTMELKVPYSNYITGASGALDVTITNAPTQRPLTPPNVQIAQPLRITNSCLAAGTMVSVGGGKARRIEDIHVGDQVASPYASNLTVIDTTIGTERTPIVHIKDSQGHELMLTEMHPLYVVDRGMVPAKLLKAGDQVRTEDGSSQLVSVTRESYPGQVFNLKVGTPEEARALGVDQTAVYANGFMVGDSQIQANYEMAEVLAKNAQPKKVSARFRSDYQSSLRRAAQPQD
jgi:hypothetical protein